MAEFDGLVAVVTGGASGIGAATVARLVTDGAKVADLDRDVPVDQDAEPDPVRLLLRADVTDDAAVRAAIERAALSARQPHGRLVDPAEVAAAIAHLAAPSSRSTTGTALAVDGGMQELRLRRAD